MKRRDSALTSCFRSRLEYALPILIWRRHLMGPGSRFEWRVFEVVVALRRAQQLFVSASPGGGKEIGHLEDEGDERSCQRSKTLRSPTAKIVPDLLF
jgi:hypothetical protein